MDFMTVVRLARRWWYLVLPMLLLTAGFALLVAQSVPVTYEATGAILLDRLPGRRRRPHLLELQRRQPVHGLGLVRECSRRRLMETVMANRTVKEELKAKGASDFTVLQGDNTLPLLDIKAEASTAQGALDTLHLGGRPDQRRAAVPAVGLDGQPAGPDHRPAAAAD